MVLLFQYSRAVAQGSWSWACHVSSMDSPLIGSGRNNASWPFDNDTINDAMELKDQFDLNNFVSKMTLLGRISPVIPI